MNALHKQRLEANYDGKQTKLLIDGFSKGFELGYKDPTDSQLTPRNLPLKCGSQTQLWNKMAKVNKRFAGP